MENITNYMGYQWVQNNDGVITIGINDTGLEELSEITEITLAAEDEEVEAEEVVGEINTDQGPMNLYSPVTGKIIEINEAVIENPALLLEDNYGDGWLFRLEATDELIDEDEDDDGDQDDDEEYDEDEE